MGFLIAKSNQTFINYDCQAQDISFDSFLSNSRSIDKMLHNYQFKEKGEFNYDFNYLSETSYRSLLYLVKNRESLREGFFLIPIPYSEDSTKCIIYPDATNNKGYSFYESNAPWLMSLVSITKVSLTATEYTNIAYYDDNFISKLASSDKWTGFIFQFDLTNFINSFSYKDLRRLTLVVNGMNSSPIRFFAWDTTNEVWYNIQDYFYYDSTVFTDSKFYLHYQMVASLSLPWGNNALFDDFTAGNKVTFLISSAKSQPILIQYIRLLCNGYWVACTENNLENFANAFTGAGRTGNLKFIEI